MKVEKYNVFVEEHFITKSVILIKLHISAIEAPGGSNSIWDFVPDTGTENCTQQHLTLVCGAYL